MQFDRGLASSARRRRAAQALLIGIAVASFVALLVTSSSATVRRSGRPTVVLEQRSPVVVSGRGFTAHRRLTITLTSSGTYTRHPRANGGGSFTVRFAVGLDRCSGWTVTATQKHHRPVVLRGARPECAPM